MQCVVNVDGLGRVTGVGKPSAALKEIVMAKVIEFYIPKDYQNPRKRASLRQRGRVIEFSAAKKSA
jgi:hypothetical protein